HRRSSKDAVSGKQVAVKAAEDEPLVLQDRSTDGATAEFFVAAGRASQWIALWIGIRADWVWSSIGARLIGMPLGVAQSIQEVALFGAKHCSVPGIRSALGDDVHQGAGVAAVFRIEVVGHDHILLHEIRVAHEQ